MYEITVKSDFSAAHQLRSYSGKCENLHGHNWKVEVAVGSKKLNSIGLAFDFKELKEILKQVLEKLDHTFLNELPYFKKYNPTSENIAKWIYDEIGKVITKNVKLIKVTVFESDNSYATYSP